MNQIRSITLEMTKLCNFNQGPGQERNNFTMKQLSYMGTTIPMRTLYGLLEVSVRINQDK